MSLVTDDDRQAAVAREFLALADLLGDLPEAGWDTPSLCEGWRVREVAAHMTMAARYPVPDFMALLQECGGDFTRLSNLVAQRDGTLPAGTLVANLRDEVMHGWTPPGGGSMGALNHVVIHGLDITVPLDVARLSPDDTIRAVLDDLTLGGIHAHFGFDLTGMRLRATDIGWAYGTGKPVSGSAENLALLMCGRRVNGH